MAKDPAVLFYTSDFLTGTMLMTNEQKGIYITLLCVQHQHGGMIDKVSFNSMVGEHEVIRVKFIEEEDGFYNKRMMGEMVKRAKKSESLSANAMVRWDKHKEKQCKSNAKAPDLQMPIEDESANENRDIKEPKKKYGEYKHVLLTITEKEKIITKFGQDKAKVLVKDLDEGIELKGYKYKNHYLAILKWAERDTKSNNKPKEHMLMEE